MSSSFSGKFQYLDPAGTAVQAGPCRLTIEDASFHVIPETGQPLALDLGDIDIFSPGDYQLSLKLYTGNTVTLTQFGKSFQNLCRDFLDAYRNRLVQCLLLEDLEEIERFEGVVQLDSPGSAFSSPAQFRLYKSNLAILPVAATGLHWRLSDFDSVDFDEAAYRLELRSGAERLVITKLAKRTREFIDRLHSAIDDVSESSSRILRALFPFLSPDQFQAITGILREGHSAPLSKIAAVHAGLEPVLLEKTVDAALKPYFDLLKNRMTAGGEYYAGYKLIRPESEQEAGTASGESAQGEVRQPEAEETVDAPVAKPDSENPEKDENEEQVLHWFFFPLASKPGSNTADVVAWESTSRSGRATYLFRISPDLPGGVTAFESAIQRLNRALVLLNFRREPIYLPDDSLAAQLRYRRYAIACRRIPVLRELRTSYLGRAIHTSPEAWQRQVDAILAGA